MDVTDDSAHSTVAGLKRAELSSRGKKGNRSLGNLRRSLPRMGSRGKSAGNLGSKKSSGGSLSSMEDGSLESMGGLGAHRSFSRAEGRAELARQLSHQFDAGSILYGVSQAVGKKDQDRYDVRLGGESEGDVHYFGVFDGHGTSAMAADQCVEQLYDLIAAAQERISRGSGDFTDEDDEEAHPADDSDYSSTASTGGEPRPASLGLGLVAPGSGLLRPHRPMTMPDDRAISLAYVQLDEIVKASRHTDPRSGACAVTMFVTAEGPANLIDEADDESDTEVKVAWAGDCRAILISQDGTVDDVTVDHRIDGNDAERERIEAAEHTPREGLLQSELWARELERAAATGDTPRPHSFIGRRHLNGVPTGPECVFSHSGGVSLQVTRSIGDAYAARCVIPDPDIVSFSVPRGEYARFVLASDGIFEIMDDQEVAKFVAKISSPAKAAAKLAAHAKQKRLYSGMSTDDITAIVVDLNPENRKLFKASNLSKGRFRGVF